MVTLWISLLSGSVVGSGRYATSLLNMKEVKSLEGGFDNQLL
jgi:hypothetical protein